MSDVFSFGIDFITNAVRIVLINVLSEDMSATVFVNYKYFNKGVFIDPGNKNMGRQGAMNYLESLDDAFRSLKNNDKLRLLGSYNQL